MIQIKTIALFMGCATTIVAGTLFAATLQVGSPSVILMAGQTIEIPLSSDSPIASDLKATGEFQAGDVTFTAGPGCHLSANGCTLLISAAPSSKSYLEVPVIVTESAASNIPIFVLSVIQPEKSAFANVELPKNISTPLIPSNQTNNVKTVAVTNTTHHTRHSLTLTSGNLSASIKSHSVGTNSYYSSSSNGPKYQLIQLTNDSGSDITLNAPVISGTDASYFSIDITSGDYAGNPTLCNNAPTLASGSSCSVIITSTLSDPALSPKTATLTINDGISSDTLTFTIADTSYVYAAGGFNTLGHASVSGGDLLAQCTAGTCSNALQGTTGNNYASSNVSVGQWINALSVTPTGNLMVGGVFGAIGDAVSGASSETPPTGGYAALLAQCTPGSVSGNACFNQMGTGIANPYAFTNAYIDAITSVFLFNTIQYVALGGDFSNLKGSSIAGGKMLAKCNYNGTSSSTSCSSYLAPTRFANNAISALDYFNNQLAAGGLFTRIAAYPTSAPSSGTTFATCTNTTCSQGMGSNNPNGSILGITNDGINVYMGGTFTQIGSYVDSSGGYPLVSCTLATTTTCHDALTGGDADGYIEGLAYSGGNLYVGGKFTTIGGATPVNNGNMLAVCTPEHTCSNFVTDTNPYATGADWGGNIAAIAVGNQTTITAN